MSDTTTRLDTLVHAANAACVRANIQAQVQPDPSLRDVERMLGECLSYAYRYNSVMANAATDALIAAERLHLHVAGYVNGQTERTEADRMEQFYRLIGAYRVASGQREEPKLRAKFATACGVEDPEASL